MFLRNFFTSMLLALTALSSGCGGGGGGASINGTVSFNGQPLERGNINFVPSDGKGTPVGGTISGGKFSVSKVPIGKCKAIVTSSLAPVSTGGMGEALQEKNKPTVVEVMPNDDGNGKEYDITSGMSLDISIKTAVSSGPPVKK